LRISPTGYGYVELQDLDLTQLTVLRRLTFRMALPLVPIFERDPFPGVISTITSPAFCELVLELGGVPSHFDGSPSEHWGHWEEIEKVLEEQFARRGGFRLVIRTGKLRGWESFKRHGRETFPLLAAMGCIHFVTAYSTEG